MFRYKCPKCKGNQYSSSDKGSKEPCIYCGNSEVQLMKNILDDEKEVDK